MHQSGYMKMIMVDGFNSGEWKSIEVRSWIEDKKKKNKSILFQAFNGDVTLKITNDGFETI